MNEDLFLEMLNLLRAHAQDCRDDAKESDNDIARDMWSAVAGNLENAVGRMGK